ncbi:MAG: fibronectin type III domain-containing protein, partial [Bacteroidales bacterium]|nr:fibronectin type III domain-containing protein [Bacteroidales bacterium]
MNAQSTATFGTGTSSSQAGGSAGSPMSGGTVFSYTQNIYTAAELTAAGVPAGAVIIAIEFSNGTGASLVLQNCRTYMAHRSTTSFSSATDYTPYNELTLVDSSDWVTTGSGWFMVNLTNPYVWNGTGNLLVAVSYGGASLTGTNIGYNYTTQTENRHWRRGCRLNNGPVDAVYASYPEYTATSTPSGTAFTTQPTVSTYRPNLRITYIVSGCPSLTPNVANIGPYTADLNWINFQQSVNSWDMMYGETGTFDTLTGSAITGITDTFYSLTGLTSATSYTVYMKPHCSTEDGTWSSPRTFTTLAACPTPLNLTLVGHTAEEATISWLPGGVEPGWEVVCVPHGADPSSATPEYATSSPYTIMNLSDNTQYDVYVRADCGTGENSYWTPFVTFTTDPYCTPPVNVHASQIQGSSALIQWNAALVGANDYTVEYSEAGANVWTSQVVTATECMLSGLTPNTAYDVRVFSNCTQSSADTIAITFTTGCLLGGDVAIGNGTTTSSYIPSYSLYKNAFTQQIFTAAEMGGAAEIHSISLYMNALGQQRNIKFYLMHTTSANLSSGWLPTDSAVLVFDSSHTYATGWNTFNFSTPFQYDGVRNLVLIAVDSNASYTSGNTWRTHSAFTGSARYVYSDGTVYTINPVPSATGTSLSTRNNIIFGIPCDSTSTCVSPNVYVSAVTDESVTIAWVAGYSETSWELEYSTDATNWTSEGTVTTSPYTIYNLTSDTPYLIRMRSVCGGGDNSNWTTVQATTPCTSITVPYFEHFDTAPGSGAGNMVSCWTRGTNSTTAYPYTSSSYAHSGTYSVYFYGTSAYYSYIASPRIDDNVQMNNLQVRFYAYKTSANYSIEVGVMTDPNDINTFETLGQFSPSATSNWEYFDVNTNFYTGSGRYIAFRPTSGITSYMYIDDVEIDIIPTCDHVTNITVDPTSITTSGATLVWAAGGSETDWEVVYGPAGSINDPNMETATQVSGSPTVDLTGLNASTEYDVYVRAICSPSDVSAWMYSSFMTACGEIATLPFSQNFDGMGTGSAVYPTCWSRYNTYSTTTSYPYVSSSYHNSGNASLYFYSSTSTYNLAILPPMDTVLHPINTLMLSFAMRSTSSVTSGIVIGVMDDPTNYSSFTPIDTVHNTATAIFEMMEVSLAQFNGSGAYIALKLFNTGGTYSVYLDDLLLEEIPECPKPTDVMALSMGDTIVLSWDDPSMTATSWDVIYGPTGFNPETSTTATVEYGVTENPYYFSDLPAGTVYDFYVRTDCGNGDVSPWSTMPATAAPYLFEMGVTGSSSIQGCGWTITDDGGMNGSYSNNCEYSVTIYPSMDSVISVSGTFTGESSLDYLKIFNGANTDASNLLGHIYATMNGGSSGTQLSFGPFTSTAGPLTLLFHSDGSVVYAGFVATTSCVATDSCMAPLGASLANVTSTEATVSWYAPSSYTGFNVAMSTQPSFDPDTCTNLFITSTTSYQFTNLTSNTTYYYAIQTNCASGGTSAWSPIMSFKTTCDVITIPYSQNFDGIGSGTTVYPDCWEHHNTYSTSTNYPYVSSSYHTSGNASLYFYNSTSTYSMAVLPPVDVNITPINTLQLTFQMRSTSSTTTGMQVGVMTDPTDPNTFVPVTTVYNTATALFEEMNVSLASYTGTGNCVAMKLVNTSSTYSAYVDDVFLGLIPTCPKPTGLSVTGITTNSVTLGWTDGGSEAEWEIAYGTPGFDPDTVTPLTVTTNPYEVQGLNGSELYQFYVRAVCSPTDHSYWSNPTQAATLCDALAVPYSENFNSYTTTATSSTAPALYPNDFMPTCWTFLNRSTSSSTYPMVFLSSYSAYAVSGNTLFFKSSSTTPIYAVLPSFTMPLQSLQITFTYRNEGTTDYNGTLSLGYMTNPSDPTTFTQIATYPRITTLTEITEVLDSIPASVTSANLAFRYTGGTSNNYYLSIDNVLVEEIPSCVKPTHVTITGSTTNSITVGWTAHGETNWNLEYGPAGFTPGTGTTITANTNPTTISGLSASTPYDVYVQADCGGGDTSSWSNAGTGATACGEITAMPYSEGFDSYGSGTTVYPLCWSKINTYSADRPYVNASGYNGACLYFFTGTSGTYNIAISPEFSSSIPMNSLTATFMYKGSSSSDRLIVGVIGSTTDATTFVPVDTVYPAASASTWTSKTVSFANYTGTGHYVAFKNEYTTTSAYAYLDNLVITMDSSVAPVTCNAPTGLAVNNVTTTTATASWTAGGTETSWNVQYKAASASTWQSATANATSYTMTGLTPNTAYQVRVQAVCDASTTSDWTTAVSFTTNQEQQTCPAPTNLTATIDATSHTTVVLTWQQEANTANEWQVNYRISTESTWSTATATSTTYTLTDLTPNVDYVANVV